MIGIEFIRENVLVLDLLEIYIQVPNLLEHMTRIEFIRNKPFGIGFIGDIHISIEFINAYDRY